MSLTGCVVPDAWYSSLTVYHCVAAKQFTINHGLLLEFGTGSWRKSNYGPEHGKGKNDCDRLCAFSFFFKKSPTRSVLLFFETLSVCMCSPSALLEFTRAFFPFISPSIQEAVVSLNHLSLEKPFLGVKNFRFKSISHTPPPLQNFGVRWALKKVTTSPHRS